jgi:hypothetical protein
MNKATMDNDPIRTAMHKCLDAAMNEASNDGNRILPGTVIGEPSIGRYVKSNNFDVRIRVTDEFERDGKTGRTIGKETRVMAILTTRVTTTATLRIQ